MPNNEKCNDYREYAHRIGCISGETLQSLKICNNWVNCDERRGPRYATNPCQEAVLARTDLARLYDKESLLVKCSGNGLISRCQVDEKELAGNQGHEVRFEIEYWLYCPVWENENLQFKQFAHIGVQTEQDFRPFLALENYHNKIVITGKQFLRIVDRASSLTSQFNFPDYCQFEIQGVSKTLSPVSHQILQSAIKEIGYLTQVLEKSRELESQVVKLAEFANASNAAALQKSFLDIRTSMGKLSKQAADAGADPSVLEFIQLIARHINHVAGESTAAGQNGTGLGSQEVELDAWNESFKKGIDERLVLILERIEELYLQSAEMLTLDEGASTQYKAQLDEAYSASQQFKESTEEE